MAFGDKVGFSRASDLCLARVGAKKLLEFFFLIWKNTQYSVVIMLIEYCVYLPTVICGEQEREQRDNSNPRGRKHHC